MWQFKSLIIKNIISFKEQNFEFRNGKAVIIIGSNLDNPNQPRNGAGKSSLIESISLAISGSSIRDVKTKELIFNGEDNGEVTLTLYNSLKNETLVIWRKIYGNTKSAEYKAWINDKEQSELYSDWNGFNAWIWKTLGISKEDFYSFFLITSIDYKPFLKVSDTDKKSTVNRFSGADKVDLALPDIQTDSEAKGAEILTVEKELSVNQTTQEVLAGQLTEEENANSETAKTKLITEKEEELTILENDQNVVTQDIVKTFESALDIAKNNVVQFEASHKTDLDPFIQAITVANLAVTNFDGKKEEVLQPFKDNLELAQLEVEAFEFTKDFEAEYTVFKNKVAEKTGLITAKNAEIPKIKERFTTEINQIENEEKELKASITEQEASLLEYQTFVSDINKQLLESITCPKCSHIFNLKDKEFNAEEAKAALPDAEKEIETLIESITGLKTSLNVGLQTKKESVNKKIIDAGEIIRNEIQQLNNEIVDIGKEEAEVKKAHQIEINNKQLLIDDVDTKQREFNLKDKELTGQRKELTDTVDQKTREHDLKVKSLENDKLLLENQVKRCEMNLNQKRNEYNAHVESVELLKKTIENIKNQELDNSKILKLEDDIKKLINEEDAINERLEKLRKEKENIDAWEINMKLFKSHLANKSIKNIEDFSNMYLQGMGSDLQILIDGYKTLSNRKIKEQITTSVLRGGFDEGSYGKFSGGERVRIDFSVIMALQEMINLNSSTGGIDFLCADEIFDQLDVIGLETIIESLQTIGKTVMIVSQNEINTEREFVLTIQKQNKVSKILN